MTDENFEKGYKALIRYFKDIGRYNDFLNITAKRDPKYKQHLKETFKKYEPMLGGWYKYFSYTYYIGKDFNDYNDPHLDNLRTGWFIFLQENNINL